VGVVSARQLATTLAKKHAERSRARWVARPLLAMGQCCAKPATLHEQRTAPAEQRNDIRRNVSDRQRAWASTGTVALRDASLQVAPSHGC